MLPLKPISLKIDLRVIKIRINTSAIGVTLSHEVLGFGVENKKNLALRIKPKITEQVRIVAPICSKLLFFKHRS